MRLPSVRVRRAVPFLALPLAFGGWTGVGGSAGHRAPAHAARSLSVTIDARFPRVIKQPGVPKTFTANASGGGGGYTYEWSVTYTYGATYAVGNDQSQPISFQCSDNGDNEVTVHVTSATGEVATASYTQIVAIDPSYCGY